MARIALIGYGKMGKAIEKIALSRGNTISIIIDQHNIEDIQKINPENTDSIIEFTMPESAVRNVKNCFKTNVPVVCGTTGWLKDWFEVTSACKEANNGFFYASNYSVGVNIFFKLNEWLAKAMNGFNQYNVLMEEIHHIHKKDEPSGTAITLAEGVLKNLDRKTDWKLYFEEQESDIAITSKRIGEVPGTHSTIFRSDVDEIEIKHTAHSREGFALGAVLAAEFIVGKKGVLGMDDMLKL
jgi:4-hydroxy-tetrahydrodipicolinate reductase